MHKVSIADLRRLVERADILLQREFKALSSHWNADKQGFHTNRETRAAGKVNVTTTCFGLYALLRGEELIDRFFAKPDKKAEATALDGVAKTLASIPWASENLDKFNIYTTPIVIQTLYQLLDDRVHGPSVKVVLREKTCSEQIREGLETIIKETTTHGAARFPPYEPNAYLTYWCFEALRRETEQKHFDADLQKRCGQQVERLAMWGEAELHRQIAYHTARDMALFDPIQLAYALRIYTGYRAWITQPVNQRLVAKTVEIVFEHQEEDGLWPKSRPIFHFSTRGSVYPFTFEMLDVLLPTKPESGLFEPYIGSWRPRCAGRKTTTSTAQRRRAGARAISPTGAIPRAGARPLC